MLVKRHKDFPRVGKMGLGGSTKDNCVIYKGKYYFLNSVCEAQIYSSANCRLGIAETESHASELVQYMSGRESSFLPIVGP